MDEDQLAMYSQVRRNYKICAAFNPLHINLFVSAVVAIADQSQISSKVPSGWIAVSPEIVSRGQQCMD